MYKIVSVSIRMQLFFNLIFTFIMRIEFSFLIISLLKIYSYVERENKYEH